jgi:hypothetical protein
MQARLALSFLISLASGSQKAQASIRARAKVLLFELSSTLSGMTRSLSPTQAQLHRSVQIFLETFMEA